MKPPIRIIYIIGFMGSGKSTAGKKLASALGWSFIDLDKKIEEHCGMAIPEIFSQHGEDHFRNIEAEVLRSLETHSKSVISTGGGTPCFGNNMEFMLKTGLTIYLKLTPGQLKGRLANSKTKRPLLEGLQNEELQSFIEEKLFIRERWYNMAEISMEGIDTDISLMTSLVRSRLNV